VGSGRTSTNARTIAAYEAGADAYRQAEAAHDPPALSAFLRAFATQMQPGTEVLEFGSATGRDAAALEEHGVCVHRTDATTAFVSRLRAQGFSAEVLNVLTDELGGPWRAMYAGAVFLHFDEAEFSHVLARTAAATVPGGLLAFTLKEGDGAHWTTAKLGRPRHFTYWREPSVRALIGRSRWEVTAIQHAPGHREAWLECLCRLPGAASS